MHRFKNVFFTPLAKLNTFLNCTHIFNEKCAYQLELKMMYTFLAKNMLINWPLQRHGYAPLKGQHQHKRGNHQPKVTNLVTSHKTKQKKGARDDNSIETSEIDGSLVSTETYPVDLPASIHENNQSHTSWHETNHICATTAQIDTATRSSRHILFSAGNIAGMRRPSEPFLAYFDKLRSLGPNKIRSSDVFPSQACHERQASAAFLDSFPATREPRSTPYASN